MKIIKLKNVDKSYKDNKVLKDISFIGGNFRG
jgi:ABC-type polar amino acid transport system ATPase subunit